MSLSITDLFDVNGLVVVITGGGTGKFFLNINRFLIALILVHSISEMVSLVLIDEWTITFICVVFS